MHVVNLIHVKASETFTITNSKHESYPTGSFYPVFVYSPTPTPCLAVFAKGMVYRPMAKCRQTHDGSCCQFISTTTLFISTFLPRQYFRNAKIIKSSIFQTSHKPLYTYRGYQYRIYRPSFSRHASPLAPPCNARGMHYLFLCHHIE